MILYCAPSHKRLECLWIRSVYFMHAHARTHARTHTHSHTHTHTHTHTRWLGCVFWELVKQNYSQHVWPISDFVVVGILYYILILTDKMPEITVNLNPGEEEWEDDQCCFCCRTLPPMKHVDQMLQAKQSALPPHVLHKYMTWSPSRQRYGAQSWTRKWARKDPATVRGEKTGKREALCSTNLERNCLQDVAAALHSRWHQAR